LNAVPVFLVTKIGNHLRPATLRTMVDHLKKHELSGHGVPQSIYKYLWDDDEENFGVAE
jgi:hypothetical protein